MAADDYHENSFIFKTVTFFRIIAGVAVTLAVLFAMVWLIDYSSPRTSEPQGRQPLLFPERPDETESRKPDTLFETLLNKTIESNAGSDERRGVLPDAKSPAVRTQTDMAQPVTSPAGRAPSAGPDTAHPEQPAAGSVRHSSAVPAPEQKQPAGAPARQNPAADGVFAVQFGSFQQEERARQLSEDLAGKGYQPYIHTIVLPDGTKAHRVRVGRFATREEALKLAAAIESREKIPVFVTSK